MMYKVVVQLDNVVQMQTTPLLFDLSKTLGEKRATYKNGQLLTLIFI